MYIGDRFEAMPIATPPAMRHVTNAANDPAHPSRSTSREEQRRRQQQLLSSEPVGERAGDQGAEQHPTSAHEFAHPTSAAVVRPKAFSKKGFAPPMTTQS